MRVFIVGGSGGIGAAIARELAQAGYEMLIHGGQNADKLEKIRQEMLSKGASARTYLAKADDPVAFIAGIPVDFAPDVLICAFGPLFEGSMGETTPEEWIRMSLANLSLPGSLASIYGPGMAERGFGRIIFFGGTLTDQIRGFRTVSAYSAAKTALGVVAKSAAKEWGARNVTCNVICPGYVETEYLNETDRNNAKKRMPRKKTIAPDEIAHIVKNIVCDLSGTINGAIISCDTGI